MTLFVIANHMLLVYCVGYAIANSARAFLWMVSDTDSGRDGDSRLSSGAATGRSQCPLCIRVQPPLRKCACP